MQDRSSEQQAPRCEEYRRRDRSPCPSRARFRVTTQAWTMLMCGTHAKPWRHVYASTFARAAEPRAQVVAL